MGSATRSALAAARDALAGEQKVTLAEGEQLLAAGRAIEGSSQLRSLLADPAIDADEKAGLIGRIFGSLDPVAARLLTRITSSRWSDQAELLDGIEEIAIRLIARAQPDAGIEAELFAFARAVSADPELELAVGNKLGDPAGKVSLVDALLGDKASDGTLVILRHLVRSPRSRRVGELIDRAASIVADARDRIVATVTAAGPLTGAQRERLVASLTERYGRAPSIDLVIDPSVIGGLRIQVGDDVVDGTVAARLTDLKLKLAG